MGWFVSNISPTNSPNYAKRNGVEISNGYKDFIINREKLEVIALTQYELDGLFNLDLGKDKRLDQVRDVFCFSW